MAKYNVLIQRMVKEYKTVEIDIPDEIILKPNKSAMRRGINSYLDAHKEDILLSSEKIVFSDKEEVITLT